MRLWLRLPVIVRAVIAGLLVLTAGNLFSGPLVYANLKLFPAVPWSVPLLAGYMWLFWQYLQGRWWPRSTAEARRRNLRANRVSSRVWFWAAIAGTFATASNFALHWVVSRFAPLGYGVPEVLNAFPVPTLLAIFVMLSVVAGIVEEAAFRGYMQGPIERRHGLLVAIAVVSIVFGLCHLTDMQPSMTAARMFFIVTASILYGIMVHLTNSILPGLVFHAAGDAVGITWIWWLAQHPRSGSGNLWLNCAVAIGFGAVAVWAFVRLARVTQSESAAAA